MTGWDYGGGSGGYQEPDYRTLVSRYERDEAFELTRYIPPGPVARRFLGSTAMTAFIMGPVGGGKTTACAMRRVIAATQGPECRDGWVRDKFVVVRDTFRSLSKTVLQSWLQWFPRGYPGSSWEGGQDRPVTHTLRFRLLDGRRIEMVTDFIGLGGHRVEEVLRGYEFSGAWVNEADTADASALGYLEQRTGRYPPRKELKDPAAPRMRLVLGDLNAPDIDNWTYQTFVEAPAAHRLLFRQPSGRSPQAENLENLEKDYYAKMIASEPAWYVRRFVDNEFGWSRDGKPVYDEFSEGLHVGGDLDPVVGLPVLVGMDAGLSPAAIIGQEMPNGQLRITDELVPGHGYGTTRFGAELAALLAARYPWATSPMLLRTWCDPAAQYGGDREGGDLAWLDQMAAILGVPVLVPAGGSNELGLRLSAVRAELTGLIDGRTPRYLVSRRCRVLIRGFASGYRYRRRPATASTDYEPAPEKNAYSHPHDANQYLILGHRGRHGLIADARALGRARMPGSSRPAGSVSPGSFDPHQVGM